MPLPERKRNVFGSERQSQTRSLGEQLLAHSIVVGGHVEMAGQVCVAHQRVTESRTARVPLCRGGGVALQRIHGIITSIDAEIPFAHTRVTGTRRSEQAAGAADQSVSTACRLA